MSQVYTQDRYYSREEVVKIIQSALAQVDTGTERHQKLHADLTLLADYIQSTRSELVKTSGIDASRSFIPSTTDELDVVISETLRATAIIMDACESIEKVAQTADNPVHIVLVKAVTSVYEACSFQDITGQRITKVIKTLKDIEKKVAESLASLGQSAAAPLSDPGVPQRDALLNGPQLKGPAMSQDEIDKLLNFFN